MRILDVGLATVLALALTLLASCGGPSNETPTTQAPYGSATNTGAMPTSGETLNTSSSGTGGTGAADLPTTSPNATSSMTPTTLGVGATSTTNTTAAPIATTSTTGAVATAIGTTGAVTSGATSTSVGSTGSTTPTPSSGCGTPWNPNDLELEDESRRGPAAQVVRREIEIAGVARRYMVVVPLDYDAGHEYPLIFAFHGLGGDREQLRGYMNLERPAEGGAIVVYPEGLVVRDGDTGWNLSADSDDLAFVDALYEQYTQELCIDEERIFATGHSYGGCMTNSVGCFRGDRIRGVAPVAGCGPNGFNTTCSGQVAAMIIHSPLDTTTDYSSGMRGCDTYIAANRCEQSPECGCYWVEALDGADNECVQEAQQPYPTSQSVEVTEDDANPPEFRQYLNCDPGFPVVQIDHYNGRDPRYHNPPAWVPSLIWEFFSGLPDVEP